jgi:hypothetical protein
MLAYQLTQLYKAADEVGQDVNNPEGGLTLDTKDEDIIEVVVDVANGELRAAPIDPGHLTERQRERLLECFYEGARKTAT